MNTKYFETMDSMEKFYWYGFIFADGYNNPTKGQFSLELQKRDIDILEKFKKAIDFQHDIKETTRFRKGKTYYYARIMLTSQEFTKILSKLGVLPNKTKSPTLIFMNDECFRHFVRGISDGDGCICIDKRGRFVWNMIVHNDLLHQVRDRISQLSTIHITTVPHYRTKYISQISINGNKNVLAFLKWLYKDATICLDRKQEKYKAIESYFKSKPNWKNTSSKYRGVYKSRNRFLADIKHHNKTVHLGVFTNEIDAAKAYNQKAIELRGSKAIINLLPSQDNHCSEL